MEIFNEFMAQYGIQILYAIVTAVAAWIGSVTAKYYKRWINTKEKKHLAKTVVTAVEQIYKTLHGEEKFAKAYEALSQMLEDNGIHITDLEIKMLIESAVGEANNVFWKELGSYEPDEPAADDQFAFSDLESEDDLE